jgi:hypothetical protein
MLMKIRSLIGWVLIIIILFLIIIWWLWVFFNWKLLYLKKLRINDLDFNNGIHHIFFKIFYTCSTKLILKWKAKPYRKIIVYIPLFTVNCNSELTILSLKKPSLENLFRGKIVFFFNSLVISKLLRGVLVF